MKEYKYKGFLIKKKDNNWFLKPVYLEKNSWMYNYNVSHFIDKYDKKYFKTINEAKTYIKDHEQELREEVSIAFTNERTAYEIFLLSYGTLSNLASKMGYNLTQYDDLDNFTKDLMGFCIKSKKSYYKWQDAYEDYKNSKEQLA